MEQGRPANNDRFSEIKPLRPVAGVAVGIAIATALQYLKPPSNILWHNIFQRLYWPPPKAEFVMKIPPARSVRMRFTNR